MEKERQPFARSRDGTITYSTDGRFIYAEKDGVKLRLDIFDRHYYKLRLYSGVPVLEIDGLRMQLVKDFKTPLHYSQAVVNGLKIPGKGNFTVLDTCMGLGYTAIAAAKAGSVSTVVTCELSDAVVTLAQWNPMSEPVFEKKGKVVLLRGSVAECIKDLDSEMFSFVIHDPPRFSHAPELYSLAFYKELYRVCKEGARIFHYVGGVGKSKGRKIEKEVEKRLAEAGFRAIVYNKRLQGLFAHK